MTYAKWLALAVALCLPVALAGAGGQEEGAAAATGGGMAASAEVQAAIDSGTWMWATLADYEQDTGNRLSSFGEAPMLAALVAAGELPPVEERISEEPLVINPFDEIGTYGGTLRTASLGPGYNDFTPVRSLAGVIQTANRGPGSPHENVPYGYKGWDISDDGMTFTMYLRRGAKWSDGHPHTAEDVEFWGEFFWHPDYAGWDQSNFGPVASVEKVDDYTARMTFTRPNPTFMGWVEFWGGWYPFRYPKHYLSQYHPKYNDDAEALAKEEGYESWLQSFRAHSDSGDFGQKDYDLPTMRSWGVVDITATYSLMERNPYFWAIDPAGNQLPYIDRLRVEVVNDQEGYNLKAVAGEIDIAQFGLEAANVSLYKENEEKGDYQLLMWKAPDGSEAAYGFNLTHTDPVLREIFQDIRFRQAMSLAINREEINTLLYFDLGDVRQAAMNPDNSYYKQEWAERFVDFDPDRANALLDEMGLAWNGDGTVRLRPDGEPLRIRLWINQRRPTLINTGELVEAHWEAVGVDVDFQGRDGPFVGQMVQANEHDVQSWHLRRTNESKGFQAHNKFLSGDGVEFGRLWEQWHQTGGEQGEEPPAKIKRLYELGDLWLASTNEDDYNRYAQELFDLASEELLIIGTVGFVPLPVIVQNKVGNFPRDVRWIGDDTQFLRDVKPDTWFLRQ